MIELVKIPKEEVFAKWDIIEQWVKNALGIDESYTSNDVKNLCHVGKLDLWIINNNNIPAGFLTTLLNAKTNFKSCHAPWLGGENLNEWVVEGFEQLKNWLILNNCRQFTWVGRKAWAKLIKVDSEQCYYLIKL